jgi:hypothetical protein
MKIQTQELIGEPLNWAVATCEGFVNLHQHQLKGHYEVPTFVLAMSRPDNDLHWIEFSEFNYNLDWSKGGPIIEDESISIQMAYPAEDGNPALWYAAAFSHCVEAPAHAHGPTPLVAAMRCYVLSKLGDVVDVPGDLLEGK